MRRIRAAMWAALALGGAVTAVAQVPVARVHGVVRDDQGRPLEEASVEVLGREVSAVTRADGGYRLQVLPGRYWVLVRHPGSVPVRRSVTLAAGDRELSFELEPRPARVSEASLLAEGGMSRARHQEFLRRSAATLGTFLTRDDLAAAGARDPIDAALPHLPGRTRFSLEQRFGRAGVWRVRRTSTGAFVPVASSQGGWAPDCPPALSVNGSRPWTGLSLADFALDDVEALEVYHRGGAAGPAEFAHRAGAGCGLVVIWTRS